MLDNLIEFSKMHFATVFGNNFCVKVFPHKLHGTAIFWLQVLLLWLKKKWSTVVRIVSYSPTDLSWSDHSWVFVAKSGIVWGRITSGLVRSGEKVSLKRFLVSLGLTVFCLGLKTWVPLMTYLSRLYSQRRGSENVSPNFVMVSKL